MDLKFLKNTILFKGLSEQDLENLLKALGYVVKRYSRNECILSAGSVVSDIGLILSGSVRMENNDIFGNTSILGISRAGGIFAESYACVPDQPLMVDVVANENCEVLMLHVGKLLSSGQVSSPAQMQFLRNLIRLTSRKNLELSQRIFHTSSKTIRGRLMSYFSYQVALQGSKLITIPLNRQQMADYLSLDRSALSKELSKMKKEGILDYHKNTFRIYNIIS